MQEAPAITSAERVMKINECTKLAAGIISEAAKGYSISKAYLYEFTIKIGSILFDNWDKVKDGIDPKLREALIYIIRTSLYWHNPKYRIKDPSRIQVKIRDLLEHCDYYPNIGKRPKAKM